MQDCHLNPAIGGIWINEKVIEEFQDRRSSAELRSINILV